MLVMVGLFASQYVNELEIKLIGYSFKDVNHHKELLLLIAAFITPVIALLSVYKKYIDSLISVCIEKISPKEGVRGFYKHMWGDHLGDVLVPKSINEDDIFDHSFTLYLGRVFAIFIVLFITVLFLLSFFIQIAVIHDVATNPSSSKTINLFIVVLSVASILISWLINILQMPMPELDYSNVSRLREIKKQSKEEYEKVLKNIAIRNYRIESKYEILISAFIYLLVFSIYTFFLSAVTLTDMTVFLPKAIFGSMIVLLLSSELIKSVKRIKYKWYLKNHTQDNDSKYDGYIKFEKRFKSIKFIIPVILSIAYASYSLK